MKEKKNGKNTDIMDKWNFCGLNDFFQFFGRSYENIVQRKPSILRSWVLIWITPLVFPCQLAFTHFNLNLILFIWEWEVGSHLKEWLLEVFGEPRGAEGPDGVSHVQFKHLNYLMYLL